MRLSTMKASRTLLAALLLTGLWCLQIPQSYAKTVSCDQFDINPEASSPLVDVTLPPAIQCIAGTGPDGLPVADPNCTPGAINPSMTVDVLTTAGFSTACLRDKATSPGKKAETYYWYNITHPLDNHGANQTCELDHLISLELGGADTLNNIWPQCGPEGVELNERYFKQKDLVENYLAAQVKAGQIKLEDAQKGIASNWIQYLEAAKAFEKQGHRRH